MTSRKPAAQGIGAAVASDEESGRILSTKHRAADGDSFDDLMKTITSGRNRALTFIVSLAVFCLLVALMAEWPEHVPATPTTVHTPTYNIMFGKRSSSTNNPSFHIDSPQLSDGEVAAIMQKASSQAATDSFGFFDGIRDTDWAIVKKNVKLHQNHQYNDPSHEQNIPPRWYAANFDPNFSCMHERRVSMVGGLGDGGKWVCDPHRIGAQVQERRRRGQNGCLIYSVAYSLGQQRNKSFKFENAINKEIGEQCEIHIFDPNGSGNDVPEGENVYFHNWGLVGSGDTPAPGTNGIYKTFQETLDALNHHKHFIDILSLDCAGCEWKVYQDWFNVDVRINQILVEVHSAPKQAIPFFETFQRHGYVTFHKENSLSKNGCCYEYSFLRLSKSFFA